MPSLDAAAELVRVELRAADPDIERRRAEDAVADGKFLLQGQMPICFAIEEDGPEFANGIPGLRLRIEERVTDPESQRPRRMVGALKEALVVPLGLAPVAGEVDLGEKLFLIFGHVDIPNCQLPDAVWRLAVNFRHLRHLDSNNPSAPRHARLRDDKQPGFMIRLEFTA